MIEAIEWANCDVNKIYINFLNHDFSFLYGLDKINIFVGENNSGKSFLMRSIVSGLRSKTSHENDDKFYTWDSSDINDDLVKRAIDLIAGNKDVNTFCKEIYDLLPSNLLSANDYKKLFFVLLDIVNSDAGKNDLVNFTVLDRARNVMVNPLSYISDIRNLNHRKHLSSDSLGAEKIIYIPVLRGIENFDLTYFEPDPSYFRNYGYSSAKKNATEESIGQILLSSESRNAIEAYRQNARYIYKNKIENVYKMRPENLFTAEDLYDEIKANLLGDENQRKFIGLFEDFISKEFYKGKDFIIIPNEKKKYLCVKIGDSSERPLHELGDGIKQLVAILYKIFEMRGIDAVFCIEEPEMNLHPGYQRQLIKILSSGVFSKHQFFITTHSNHIIDSSIEGEGMAIYKFSDKGDRNQITNVAKTDPSILSSLGVHNSSVFIANCVIFVEGISDKILISKYLDIYMNYGGRNIYREDVDYTFVEYGGGNIAHWLFSYDQNTNIEETIHAYSVANKIFLICDNDNTQEKMNSKKQERKDQLKRLLKDDFYELTVREIENTISHSVLERVLNMDRKANSNSEAPITSERVKAKYDNPKTYMGTFINKYYGADFSFCSPGSKTIIDKYHFAKSACNEMNGIEDLSVSAIKLCSAVYGFIERSNS